MPAASVTHSGAIAANGAWSALRALLGSKSPAPIDWPALMALPAVETLLPLLHASARGLDVPEPHRSRLREAHLRNKRRNALLRKNLAEVLRAWRERGIEAMLLKGALSLCAPLYPEGGRWMQDLDVLVRRRDLPAALEALAELGYGVAEGAFDTDYHAAARLSADGICEIGVHWQPLERKFARYLDADALWERAWQADIDGTDVLVPHPEDMLWHGFLHGQLTHSLFWREPAHFFKAHYELGAILRYFGARIDPLPLIARARRTGCERGFGLALFFLQEELGLRLPAPLAGAVRQETAHWGQLDWAHHAMGLPRQLTCALHRFLLALLSDGRGLAKAREIGRVLFVDSALRESAFILRETYRVGEGPLLPLVRFLHLGKMLAMQLVVLGYYGRYRLGRRRG